MKVGRTLALATAAVAWIASSSGAAEMPAPVLVDGFEDAGPWAARPADGVALSLRPDAGRRGRALRLDFDFKGGGGYAVARRLVSLDLPDDYAFAFWVRGDAKPNHLEFKLVDSTGDNVWWHVERDLEFGPWRRLVIKKRQITFAWGPRGGGEIRHVAALEFAVTAGQGGRGSVWLDELELIPRTGEAGPPPLPRAWASSSAPGYPPEAAIDSSAATGWRSRPGPRGVTLTVDFGRPREFSAIELSWETPPSRTVVEGSFDGVAWDTLLADAGGAAIRWLPESETRFLRLVMSDPKRRGIGLRDLLLRPVDWAPTRTDLFLHLARRGRGYPRGMTGQQPYWTVLGVDGDAREALLSEDGAIESGKGGWTIEPVLVCDQRANGFGDFTTQQGLVEPGVPIAWTRWSGAASDAGGAGRGPRLTVEAFADGPPGASWIVARYRLTGIGNGRDTLYLAIRPFQVNPPSQFLGIPGGVARVRDLSYRDRIVRVNGEDRILCLTMPAAFGAATFDQGEVAATVLPGSPRRLPAARSVSDPFEAASGALEFPIQATGDTAEVVVALSLYPGVPGVPARALRDPAEWADEREAAVRAEWRHKLGTLELDLPDSARDLAETVRANLGWILVNRDGPAIQPGSRSYERSWIRDGSLTSTALLRAGRADVVRDFLLWFASHQYPNGKVPCCVDTRGADPVPENDSHGELIYLAAEYARHTGDRATLECVWPNVRAAAAVIDSLRQSRRTAEYRTSEKREFFGVLPASISHEGYSAKPMHSYWDTFFGLRGLKDAAWLAGWLGQPGEQRRLEASYLEFRRDVVASLRLTMARHRIDYLPGCVELGDFDATSTTIAVSPVDEVAHLPPAALQRTFEGYWDFFRKRRDGVEPWEAFTPYEMRAIGALVRLGWRDRSLELLDWFMKQRRPPAWRQWPEVVWKDARAPHFIGDLPHTWVGSDFVRSVLDGLAFEREGDSSLVVAAGVPERWIRGTSGVHVRGLSTHYGRLALDVVERGDSIAVSVGGVRVPRGGVVVRSPLAGRPRAAWVDGRPVAPAESVVLRRVPGTVVFR